jgi:hypothetical protein
VHERGGFLGTPEPRSVVFCHGDAAC